MKTDLEKVSEILQRAKKKYNLFFKPMLSHFGKCKMEMKENWVIKQLILWDTHGILKRILYFCQGEYSLQDPICITKY